MIDNTVDNSSQFKKRVQMIRDLFSSNITPEDVMAHCITSKLDASYIAYVHELENSMLALTGKDPLIILKKLR